MAKKKKASSESEQVNSSSKVLPWLTAVLVLVSSTAGATIWFETKADRSELDKIQEDIEALKVLTATTTTSIEHQEKDIAQLRKLTNNALELMNNVLKNYTSPNPVSRVTLIQPTGSSNVSQP